MTYLCQPRLASLNPRLLTLEGASFIGGMLNNCHMQQRKSLEWSLRTGLIVLLPFVRLQV